MQSKKVVVISGASSGIGLEVSKLFTLKKHHVFCLSRTPINIGGVTHISCDVSKEEDCQRAIIEIVLSHKKIDILVNNAGMGISGSIENSCPDLAKKIFEVNFFGTFHLIKSSLPHMQENSRIINVSSVASKLPIAFQSFYSASKAAIDIFGDCLRMEVSPFKIKVTTIYPGDTKTNFTNRREKGKTEGRYLTRVEKSVGRMEKDEQKGMPAERVAKVIFSACNKKRPPHDIIVGFQYKLFVFLGKVLPKRLVTFILSKLYA